MKILRCIAILGGFLSSFMGVIIAIFNKHISFYESVGFLLTSCLTALSILLFVILFRKEWMLQSYQLQETRYKYRRLIMQVEALKKKINQNNRN